MNSVPICVACKRNWYSAPGGCLGKPYPHSKCPHFQEDILSVVEKRVGCDGTKSPRWIRSEVPADCPKFSGSQKQ